MNRQSNPTYRHDTNGRTYKQPHVIWRYPAPETQKKPATTLYVGNLNKW